MGKTIRIMLLSSILMGITGCDKVNQENYQKIETGMKYQDVITILGEPGNCQAFLTAKSCQWGTETRKIDIKFIGDEVMLYASAGLQ
jgi:hypothetical protein